MAGLVRSAAETIAAVPRAALRICRATETGFAAAFAALARVPAGAITAVLGGVAGLSETLTAAKAALAAHAGAALLVGTTYGATGFAFAHAVYAVFGAALPVTATGAAFALAAAGLGALAPERGEYPQDRARGEGL